RRRQRLGDHAAAKTTRSGNAAGYNNPRCAAAGWARHAVAASRYLRNPAALRSRCRQWDQPRYHTTANAITTIAFAIPAPLINGTKFGGAHGFTVPATTKVMAAVSKSATMMAQLTGVIMMDRTTDSGVLANHQLAA